MYRISFYVPEIHAPGVKTAIFEAGAGRIGGYDHCCWETPGTGQFRPLAGSHPAVGRIGETEKVDELKIETVCEEQVVADVVHALVEAHPYEEPAYGFWKILTLGDSQ